MDVRIRHALLSSSPSKDIHLLRRGKYAAYFYMLRYDKARIINI